MEYPTTSNGIGNAYLLELEERNGQHRYTTRHIIRAGGRQYVKYHYHRTMKDRDCRDAHNPNDKHELQGYYGNWTTIAGIHKLDPREWDVLNQYVPKWPKV